MGVVKLFMFFLPDQCEMYCYTYDSIKVYFEVKVTMQSKVTSPCELMIKMDDSFYTSELVSEFDAVDAEYCARPNETLLQKEIESSMTAERMEVSDSDSDCDAVNLSVREADETENVLIDDFIKTTCKCHFGLNGQACSSLFSQKIISTSQMDCQEMSKAELDLVILSHLEAKRRTFEGSEGSSHVTITYWFHGHRVCKTTYLFLHAVGPKRFKNLVAHFGQNGMVLRTHGNTKQLPANTVSYSVTQDILHFITYYANVYGLPLPGRLSGQYSSEKALLLPIHDKTMSIDSIVKHL